jgi:hypothetical protein
MIAVLPGMNLSIKGIRFPISGINSNFIFAQLVRNQLIGLLA